MAGTLGRDGEAVELAREADGKIADVDHLLHFAEPFLQDLAGLDRDEAAEFGLVRAQRFAEQPHQLAAPRRGHDAPSEKSLLRRVDGTRDIARRHRRKPCDLDAVDRRAGDEAARRERRIGDAEPAHEVGGIGAARSRGASGGAHGETSAVIGRSHRRSTLPMLADQGTSAHRPRRYCAGQRMSAACPSAVSA
jgi:hypothetical protein